MEFVLKTVFNKPLTSFELERFDYLGICILPISSSMLKSILLLNVIMEALLADYFT